MESFIFLVVVTGVYSVKVTKKMRDSMTLN